MKSYYIICHYIRCIVPTRLFMGEPVSTIVISVQARQELKEEAERLGIDVRAFVARGVLLVWLGCFWAIFSPL